MLACPWQACAAVGHDLYQGLDVRTARLSTLSQRIERETMRVARILSPEGRRAMQQSMYRFFQAAEGYCQGDTRCLRDRYWNHLGAIQHSVYRVGQLTVYNTALYALEWADEDLQGAAPHQPTWDLEVTWPRLDWPGSADGAKFALAARVHQAMADWAQEGWDRSLDVHLEEISDCYVSASIFGSTYTGGAHPYEDFSTFNWNVKAARALQNTDLFRTDTEWKSAIAALYRQRLQAGGADLSEWEMSAAGTEKLFTDRFVITDQGLRFVEHEGDTRNDTIPAVELSWSDLAPWLNAGVTCRG